MTCSGIIQNPPFGVVISALFSLTATAYLLTLGILTVTSRMGYSDTKRLSLTSQLMNESVLRRNRFAATRIPF